MTAVRTNSATSTSLLAAGVGAGLMYFLDPSRGRRRRALVRDKVAWARRKTRDAAGATRRDLGNRLEGATARLQARLRPEPASDEVVTERVRAELGRIASHPRAIHVATIDGCVVLTGHVLASELPSIVTAIPRVRGVVAVDNRMQVHASGENVRLLQGGSEPPRHWPAWLKSGWSPTALAACAGAAAVTTAIMARRSM